MAEAIFRRRALVLIGILASALAVKYSELGVDISQLP
jgi:hypothetical protein